MSTLTLSIVQADLHWHDADANRSMFDDMLEDLRGQTDLIILPEMCTTGFTMDAPEQAETMDGPSIQWMRTGIRTARRARVWQPDHRRGRWLLQSLYLC